MLRDPMLQRIGFGLLWLAFSVYAIFIVPAGDQAAINELIRRLIAWDIEGINPLIVAEFSLMGILPLIYTSLLVVDGHRQKSLGQKIPAWPFALLMMGVGAFALLPYLVIRRPLTGSERIPTPLPWVLKIWNSRWLGALLVLPSVGFFGFGLVKGDWADFIQAWQSNKFIHVMTLDFVVLSCVLPFVIGDDRVGRDPLPTWAVGLVNFLPWVGALAYLCGRPKIEGLASAEE